jgi:hypothetical protein
MLITMRSILILATVAIANVVALSAQSSDPRPCLKLLAILPTSPELMRETAAVGPDTRERFELRECGGLQVHAFERGNESPSLRVDTGDVYPPYLFHLSNILAFQSLGGASDHVYVFAFEKGKPRLVLQMATKDAISVSVQGVQRTATILIPPTTYPSDGRWPPTPPPKKLVLPLQ